MTTAEAASILALFAGALASASFGMFQRTGREAWALTVLYALTVVLTSVATLIVATIV